MAARARSATASLALVLLVWIDGVLNDAVLSGPVGVVRVAP